MDKKLREDLKHDKLQQEFTHTVEYLGSHKEGVRKYGGIGVGVLLLAGAVWAFIGYQRSSREEDLRKATLVLDAFVGDQNPSGGLAYKTQIEKDLASSKAFADVASRHSGTREGLVARFHAASLLCDQGKMAECEAGFKEVSNGSDAEIASLGKLSLATLYQAQGKIAEAEAVLRPLLANPTAVVSKEQVQISLARILARSKPQEARLIVESLKDVDRPAVSRAAVGVLGELTGQPVPQR